jgi:hypothetical protein
MPISSYLSVTYHDDKVLLCMAENLWCVLTVDNLGGEKLKPWWNLSNQRDYFRDGSYVLESRGKLIWVSILVLGKWVARAFSGRPTAARHTFGESTGVGRTNMCWVATDVRSLGDRVLFLGSPTSFAVDVAQLGVADGCAYFVYRLEVFRYNLVSGEAKLVERLRPAWAATESFMWLRRQATTYHYSDSENQRKASNKIRCIIQ